MAPGNSIGTLHVAGDLTFDPASRYEVEVDPNGSASDRVDATGQVALNGASVSHIGLNGDYKPHSVYTIVSAGGGVSGTFGGVSSTYAFLTPSLSYDPKHVYLELDRNNTTFSDVAGTARAAYRGSTAQVFGEAGYALQAGPVSVEPYAGLAYVNQHMHGYDENSPAGLHGDSDSDDNVFSTLGARMASQIHLGRTEATLHGTLGWRHAYGSVTPTATHAFDGGPDFTVSGTPIARDAALIEAGLDLRVGRATTVGVAYQGQIGQGTQQHGVMAQVNVRF